METSTKPILADLSSVAKNLELPKDKVVSAVKLLDDGNTIPFITRYRKDETGGLGERQLRDIKSEVARQNALAERKSFVLNAIENQGKLSDELRHQIDAATQSRQVEDIYIPFKPRKTSLAETARQQGLEPLARDILEGHQPDIDLASRATDFVRVDKGLNTVDEVINGVKHILAERFSEHLQLRHQLRDLYWETGKVSTELVPGKEEPKPAPNAKKTETAAKKTETAARKTETASDSKSDKTDAAVAKDASSDPDTQHVNGPASVPAASEPAVPTKEDSAADTIAIVPSPNDSPAVPEADPKTETELIPAEAQPAEAQPAETAPQPVEVNVANAIESSGETSGPSTGAPAPEAGVPNSESTDVKTATASIPKAASAATAAETPKKKRKKKKKKKKSRPEPFAEFASFQETLQKLPPHRTLAINRGEKAGKLKVRLFADESRLTEIARKNLVPQEHPFREFLGTVSDDAMQRLIIPGIEREIRRDLTEKSENHAVNVFARNLRHLFLQPPVRGKRIMGIDPGYRSGCKVAVIDATGQPVGHGVFSIVGNADRLEHNRDRIRNMINEHNPELIAIGNGSGCRAVEQFVSDVISADNFSHKNVQYTIVNQAGTSGYSTSELGQAELPEHDPVIRSAISIARRLQDPLSELVKVNPANVGVGLYQHDIKAKHLAESLESVVESCVNYVGVNANTASPALLRYISGLGQTTARKLVDHRNDHGPFVDREKLKGVSGFGEVTFVQSAGFLRVDCSDNLLDQTSIHPEDYELANKILGRLDCSIDELIRPSVAPSTTPPTQPVKNTTPEPVAETQAPGVTAEVPAENQSADKPAPDSAVPSETSGEPVVSEPAPAETSSEAASDNAVSPMEAGETKTEPQPNPVVAAIAAPQSTALSPAQLAENRKRRKEIVQKIRALDATQLAKEFGVGEMKLRDLIRSLRNPSHDPREDLPAPVFRKGILKFDDLKQGMQLRGQIVNVVDFGVFLNIGIGESCLVHISRLANRYVRDPHWFYSVGDVLNVWVQEVDSEKRRVTLTAIRPDSQKRERRPGGNKPRSGGGGERGGRPQRGERRPSAGSGRGGKKRFTPGRGKPHNKRPRKPKPVTPITDEMVDGKEPMRSFSDLLQFHKRKADDDGPDDKKGKSK